MGRTNRRLIEDDRWKRKAGAHRIKEPVPEICPRCNGLGSVSEVHIKNVVYNNYSCQYCLGTGMIDSEE